MKLQRKGILVVIALWVTIVLIALLVIYAPTVAAALYIIGIALLLSFGAYMTVVD